MIYVIPAIILLILIVAVIKKLPSYELFIEGAEDGMKIVLVIFQPLVAVLSAAYMLRTSGTLDLIISFLSPL
ncbi:MAG: spore maturation protein, partial [Clostridia bacterium]|nr:spore maturation protein [Clostridia bacterium]